jgi:hypothetical protein
MVMSLDGAGRSGGLQAFPVRFVPRRFSGGCTPSETPFLESQTVKMAQNGGQLEKFGKVHA